MTNSDPSENKLELHQGGCLCGDLRYLIEGTPLYSAHCHCRSCQRAIGAAFATWSAALPDNFQVTKGQLSYFESSPQVWRGFCKRCGTSLTYQGEGWAEVGVLSATLDAPARITPCKNVYLDHQISWVTIDASLKNHATYP